jgi:hypothetical protein
MITELSGHGDSMTAPQEKSAAPEGFGQLQEKQR